MSCLFDEHGQKLGQKMGQKMRQEADQRTSAGSEASIEARRGDGVLKFDDYLPEEARHSRDVEGRTILITGICGSLGRTLVRELHRSTRVVGIDRRAFPDRPKDVAHYEFDLRRTRAKDIFRHERPSALIHLGALHDPRSSPKERHSWNIVGFQRLLDYSAQFRIPKLIILSGADVYGAHPSNPQFLTEDAPLLGAQENGHMRDRIELDMLAQSHLWRYPEIETVILRPAHIVGAIRSLASSYLRLDRPFTILGYDPMVQITDERDVARAMILALKPGVRGIFNIRGSGELPLSKLIERLGKRAIPIPRSLLRGVVSRAFQVHLSAFTEGELDHLRFPCTVDDSRARETLGYAPRYSLEESLARLS